ncbi:MAG: hypothetical protein U0794_19445 [Isosphaeraceae bacterium]
MTPVCLDRTQVLQTLQGLMERLTSPDLTAAEANDLRPRLNGLLEALDHAMFTDEACPRRNA